MTAAGAGPDGVASPGGSAHLDLAARIRADLLAARDEGRAPAMQAYMRSAMPFLGVGLTGTRTIALSRARAHDPSPDLAVVRSAVEQLWRNATYREERYAAQALLRLPVARARLDLLPLHREIIVTGDWWDHTDEAMHRIGELLAAHTEPMTSTLLAWSTDPNRWLRRSAVIAQLERRQDTDTALLTAVVEANATDPDFFLRKAIGWALRQYARTDPDWVRAFVADHQDLSPLSVREAMKHLGGPGMLGAPGTPP